jgi:hypothetical protein
MAKQLTIGMVTYDDFDGVWFTVQALRMFHAEAMEEVEFLILDNQPTSKHGQALKRFAAWLRPEDRVVPVTNRTGTAVRDELFALARTPAVLCVDCHVLIQPGAIRQLLDLFARGEDEGGLLQGPLLMDNLTRICTHFNAVWQAGMWGVWAEDERGKDLTAPAFDIPSQGLGLFACRVSDWQGFNPHFRGFGGEEGYIHEKFRQAGKRTLCLPWLRWSHRFERPAGIPYPHRWEDRIFNYALGHLELGLPLTEFINHFNEMALNHLVSSCVAEASALHCKTLC